MTKTKMIMQRKWLKSHITLKICSCIFCKSQRCVHCKGSMNSPEASPGTWCHTCSWTCPLSSISARERASLSASVQIRLHGKSIVWENSGAKERATVLVILSSCTISQVLTHQILKIYMVLYINHVHCNYDKSQYLTLINMFQVWPYFKTWSNNTAPTTDNKQEKHY